MRSLLLLLVACSSAKPAGTSGDVDASTSSDPDGDTDATAIDASIDAPAVVDTCAPPTAAFATDLPPTAGSNTTRRRAALQVDDTGALRAFSSDLYQNGSFFDANIMQHARGPTWSQSPVANGGIGLSIGRYMATTGGSDPCLAYSKDYDGTLHLDCASTVDRTLAPAVQGALSLAVHGANKHLVYENGAGALVHMMFDGDPGTATPIHTSAWEYGASSLAVDASGNLHLAYVVIDSDNKRAVRYAVRQGTTWTTETIEDDTWMNTYEDHDSVSLALVDGAPVIAYHHRGTKSLKLAERAGTGFTKRTLLAPDPAFSSDSVGQSVAIASDCVGRVHLVYQRNLTTDAQPNLHLAYAQVTANGLEHRQFLPMTASTAYTFGSTRHGLDFVVGEDGKQYVAAQINSIFGLALYVASR